MTEKKIMIAMSGGVDSTVAALLLKEGGYTCAGAMMRLFLPEGADCAVEQDSEKQARLAADRLNIPFYLWDMQEEFRRSVIEYFIESYAVGETPNPCVFCNKTVKFGAFAKKSEDEGYPYIATGHYARIEKSGDRYILLRACDPSKDQSYVLWSLSQEVLSRLALPLGKMTKSEAREAARAYGLENSDRGDSQDICFVPDGDYASFIARNSSKVFPEGDFVTADGRIMGRHRGIINYTIGQRRGLGLSLPAPLYVKEKNIAENKVILCDNIGLFSDTLHAKNVNWIAFDSLTAPISCTAKIRYRHAPDTCTVYPAENGRIKVVFDTPQRAISPGQSVVLYDGDCVLGGGEITAES